MKDKILFHYQKSVFSRFNPNFWNPEVSWKNKYKNQDPAQGEKFLGSTTFLVFVTDAFHLLSSIELNCMLVAVALALGGASPVHFLLYLIGIKAVYGLFFNVFFDVLLKK